MKRKICYKINHPVDWSKKQELVTWKDELLVKRTIMCICCAYFNRLLTGRGTCKHDSPGLDLVCAAWQPFDDGSWYIRSQIKKVRALRTAK